MSAEKHPYRTGIITSLIAAIIWSFVPGWSWTYHAIRTALSVFIWQIPVWLIILFAGLTTFLILFWRSRRGDTTLAYPNERVNHKYEDNPEFCDYVEDRFFGVVWRWVITALTMAFIR